MNKFVLYAAEGGHAWAGGYTISPVLRMHPLELMPLLANGSLREETAVESTLAKLPNDNIAPATKL